jgi:hypothetical protein
LTQIESIIPCRTLNPTEQPSTLKEVAPNALINEHQLSSSNISAQMNNDNYVFNVLNELPEQWIGNLNLHVIADRKDAIWMTNRIFQDVERGLVNAQFRVEEFNHLCDLTFTLKIALVSQATAINPVFSFILTHERSHLFVSRYKLTHISSSL